MPDIAARWRPSQILLWQKVADDPEAGRILARFPEAPVRVIQRQALPRDLTDEPGAALRHGKRILMVGHASRFVHGFDGQLGPTVRCCPYLKLVPVSNGCPYYCTYCYLAYVYRNYAPYIKININHAQMIQEIRRAAAESTCADFNMGEMLDSLALEPVTQLMEVLVPVFRRLPRAHLMLLTKSAQVQDLLRQQPTPQVVVSWSLNSERAIKDHEMGTAGLSERVDAAARCQQRGWRVRFRFDPLLIYEGWQDDYARMIQRALSAVRPENITLGSLRFLPAHPRLAAAAYGARARRLYAGAFAPAVSDRKLRFPAQRRIELYRRIVDCIRDHNREVSVSLCKETPEVWGALRGVCSPGLCNCVTW